MTEQSNPSFVRAFLPGLVIGLIVGGIAGAVLPELIAAAPLSTDPVVAPGGTDTERDARNPGERDIPASDPNPEIPGQGEEDPIDTPAPLEDEGGDDGGSAG